MQKKNITDLFAYWVILQAFLLSADFFQNQLFRKNLSGILSECQTVWIQIRPIILSGLIWVQTVCKGYQQMTIVRVTQKKNITELFAYWVILHAFCHLLILFKINFLEKFFQEYYQSVKQFGSRSGPTFCRA